MCAHSFKVSVLQDLSDRDPVRFEWDLQRSLSSSLWAIPCLMFSSAGVAPLLLGFSQVAQRHSDELCRLSLLDVPSLW